MWRLNRIVGLVLLITLAFNFQHAFATPQEKSKPTGTPVLWEEPADISSRDLYLGPGGEEMKPALESVTFIKEKNGGYSTKYEVKDASGREWVAKLGKEAQSDTAANRLLWAAGYVTEVAYLAPRVEIKGKGTLENVRFEARPKDVQRVGDWKWKENPFVGTREFQGLKVMMMLINNWDIKDSNNEILAVRGQDGTALHYIISDLGGSLGKTGGFFSRSRNKPEDFVKARFVESVKNGRVDFNYGGKNKSLFDDITVEQARWLGNLLSRLSDAQLRDAFRAANYSAEEVEDYAQAMRERINELVNLQG